MDTSPSTKLLDRTRTILRRKHYAYSTEQQYLSWIRWFILFHGKRHPIHMGRLEIEAFLTHLAIKEHISASTQNQALDAILFLYRTALETPLDFPIDAVRAQRPIHVPTVLPRAEVRQILTCLTGQSQLMSQLLYGGGLRATCQLPCSGRRNWRAS